MLLYSLAHFQWKGQSPASVFPILFFTLLRGKGPMRCFLGNFLLPSVYTNLMALVVINVLYPITFSQNVFRSASKQSVNRVEKKTQCNAPGRWLVVQDSLVFSQTDGILVCFQCTGGHWPRMPAPVSSTLQVICQYVGISGLCKTKSKNIFDLHSPWKLFKTSRDRKRLSCPEYISSVVKVSS